MITITDETAEFLIDYLTVQVEYHRDEQVSYILKLGTCPRRDVYYYEKQRKKHQDMETSLNNAREALLGR